MEKAISVVVADYSEDFRILLGEAIDEQSDMYIAASTDDGLEAAQIVEELMPDVLISELLLSKLEGLALLRKLAGRGAQPSTILVSGFYNNDVAKMAGELGVKRFFPKPCSLKELIEAIRQCAAKGADDKRERIRERIRERKQLRRAELERELDEALFHSGIMAHLRGRDYLRAAILAAAENRELLHGVTKVLYPELAEHFGTSAVSFERCMRKAIERAWRDGNAEKRLEYFGEEYREALREKPGTVTYMKLVLERLDKNACIGR